MAERIHKRLAQAGIASRRQIESWVAEGRIKINGKVAVIGQQIEEKDSVSIDDRPVNLRKSVHQPTRVLLYKKMAGEIVTRDDPEKRPTIFKRLPRLEGGRWIAIGRLDINTSGLLLLTNDGELARRLMHPSYEVEREYAVRVHGEVTNEILNTLKTGVQLEDGEACFEAIKEAKGKEGDQRNRWFHVILREGKNREVRRLWESQGLEVSRLMRVRFGPIALIGGIKAGTAIELPKDSLKALCAVVDYTPVPVLGVKEKPRRAAPARKSAKASGSRKDDSGPRTSKSRRDKKFNTPRSGDKEAPARKSNTPGSNTSRSNTTSKPKRDTPAKSTGEKTDSVWGRNKR